MTSFAEYTKKKKKQSMAGTTFGEYTESLLGIDIEDIAPIRTVSVPAPVLVAKEKDKLDFFQKPKDFDKGNPIINTGKTILGTTADLGINFIKGGASLVEGVKDLSQYGIAYGADKLGDHEFADSLRKLAQENSVEKASQFVGDFLEERGLNFARNDSVSGRTTDAVAQGFGQLVPLILTGGLASSATGATALTTGAIVTSSAGSGMSEAYNAGATDKEATIYGFSKGAIEGVTEMIFGGLGKTVKALGFSRGLSSFDDQLARKLSSKISNHLLKNATEFGIKAGAEGVEEVIAGYGDAIAKKLTYMSDEELSDLVEDENLLEAFVVGSLVSAGSQSGYVPGTSQGSLKEANATGRDFITGYTQNEQAVIDKVVEQRVKEQETEGKKLKNKEIGKIEEEVKTAFERGEIDIDTIESVVGGDLYSQYDNLLKESQEYEQLYKTKDIELSQEQRDRRDSLIEKNKKKPYETELSSLKERLSQEIDTKTQNDTFIRESYNEKARRSKAFEADLTKYDEKQQAVVQKAVESGILNDTRKTHEFVDMIAKLSADKGVLFDFTNNDRLKESGFAIEGKTINGYVKDGNIALNINSNKALNTVVGHEITHVLEGTEFYSELQTAIKEYATTKGDYDSRFEAIKKLYEGVDGVNLENEITADLVGDYLFTDSDFINSLSTKKPNVFKKIYDEIKYFLKIATPGSKEAKELAKVKRAFDKAYKENSVNPRATYDLSEDVKLKEYIEDALAGKLPKKSYYKINEVIPERLANDIEGIVGFSVKDFSNEISPNHIKHINARHGEHGKSDQSMKDISDIARIGYVIENYDRVIKGDINKEYRNSDGSPSQNIVLQKKLDDNYYYVVEAVPDASKKTLHVVSAYINKNDTFPEVDNAISPIPDVQNVPQSNVSFDNSIAQNKENATETTKKLTKEQEEYFKDSVVRDENGNLKVMYHGTSKGGHTVFDPYGASKYGLFGVGSYFTDNKSVAESYTEKGKGNNKQIYETYLNITNPIDMDAQANPEAWKKALPEVDYPQNGTNEDFYRAMEEYFADNEYSKDEATETALDVLESMGYDGITHIGGGRFNKADDTRHQVYIAFHPEQIKNIDNSNPTENADIRYSLSEDSEGNTVSPAVQKRFENSKAVDENGSLKVLYHGTPSGEFTIFDKTKGSIEGDFGSGFYFTDNEADVETNYEGGGPDFENKVARRAEQIEAEEDIDYDEAEQRAREELYKGSNKFEVYLNIENPAIVGETILFDHESYLENYDPDDYDDYDDYLADIEQLVSDDIENIVWEVEKNVDLYSTDGISNVLFDAYYEGGIGIEDLKARINELYLEDSEGNMAGNEVTRQIIESLGYDGIIDNTVSSKFRNMGLEEGTTHYIVFKPNQIKSITNQNPTDNPDINLSLSDKNDIAPTGKYNVYGKDIALETVSKTENVAPVAKQTEVAQEVVQETDEYAPMTEAEANERDAMQSDRLYSLDESDMPEEVEAPYSEPIEAVSPFDDKDIQEVGDRKQKAYMYENPEVKPYFQEEAQVMLGELRNSVKGERVVNADLVYESGGEFGVWGTKRETSEQIAYMLDRFKYSYADIEKGLNAIIEDHGAENNAISKRLEFMIDERLREGYTDFLSGMEIPSNQDYINLLRDKQINNYSDEAYNQYLESLAGEFAEDIAPTQAYEAIEPQNLDALEEQWAKNKMVRADSKKEAEEIAKILDEEPTTENKRNSRKWAIFKANVLDKGAVFEDLALKNKNRELMGKWNYTLYSESRAQRLMGEGDKEAGIKSLNDIIAEVGSTGLTHQFYEYVYHKHNVDRMSLEAKAESKHRILKKEIERLKLDTLSEKQLGAISREEIKDNTTPEREHLINTVKEYLSTKDVKNKPVFGYSVTAEMSQEIVDQYEFAQPEFMDFANDLYKYNNYLRQQLVDNGVISQETADLWSDMYPHYVPIRRVNAKGLNINVPLDTGRTGVNAPVKGATGGNTNILPLFDTMAMRTLQTYKATAKNSFGVELKNTLGTVVDKTDTNVDEVIESIDAQEELLQEGKNGQKPTFTVFQNGERVTYEITEDMYDALKPLSDSNFMSKTIKPLNVASNFHRGLLTEYNPVFIITNGIKDIQDVLINSQHPARTYAKIPEAFAQLTKKGYWYDEYMNNGGDHNSYFDSDTNTFKTENKGLAKVLDLPPFSTISKLNNYVEMIPRLAEYIASREAGRSIEVSMLDSARVTTNFRAGGDLTKWANRNGATFLNASVQGAMQQVRNIREAKMNGFKGWANLATKFAIAGAPAFLLNALMWDDDDEYEELSDYVKQNYYIVGKYDDGKFIRIPKGRTVAVIQDAIKQISNVATGNDEADLKSFLELVVTNIAPANPIESNILAPIIQVKNNETWYGEDLVPTRLQDLPASEQFDESTDSISKWLGEKLDISPVKINYLLDQYTGGVGDVVLPMLTPEAESGDNSTLGNMIAPLKKKFTVDSVMNNQNVSDFYDTSDELTTNAKMSTATDEDILKNKYINSVSKEMSDLYKLKREVQNSDLPDSTKYERVREIQSQIVELSKEGLKSYKGVSISGDYGTVGDRHYKRDEEGEWKKLTDKQLEKQEEVTSGLGISASEYWSDKEEYDYAYEKPEKYAMSKVFGGYDSYRAYTKELDDITADKDENGKTITGSRKEKVLNYVNNLDADYGTKIILFKSVYNADDDYNYDIIEYLNSRNDISYEEEMAILKELGFTVDSDGTIYWD